MRTHYNHDLSARLAINSKSDCICLEDLQVESTLGVFDWERLAPQPLIIDLSLITDFETAIRSDSLSDTIDYSAVLDVVKVCCQENQFHLLESLAHSILSCLFLKWPVDEIFLCIKKPKAVSNSLASIRCYRTREMMSFDP